MAGNKKSVNLLPENLRTTKNTKFLSSTIDPLISTPELERIDGYVGSKLTPNYNPNTDFYLKTSSPIRKNYSLEPALIFKNNINEINDIIAYDDLINELTNQGVDTSNLAKLFQSKYYSFDPFIDWDKFINFSYYHWLPFGPDAILIDELSFDVEEEILEKTEYIMPNGYSLSNGMKIKFLDDVTPATYANKEFIVEGVGSSITLIDFSLLESNQNLSSLYNETFDKDRFDSYSFDGDTKLPITPEYITINKASIDLNSWSRYNRWFHRDVIEKSFVINNRPVDIDNETRAVRPIIEFKPNLQLYNFGRNGIQNIDLFDTTTKNAFDIVDGSYGYYIDGVMLEHGHRVIFNVDLDSTVKGKIYQVELDISSDVPRINLVPAPDFTPNNLDSLSVNLGMTYAGKSFYYNSTDNKWIHAQQHTNLNQAPLFDLFDKDGVSFNDADNKNNFVGTKIFSYDVGTGAPDKVLGFPLKYQNSIGIGSYLFRNYFMTETISKSENNTSSQISTGITFVKLNNEDGSETLANIWGYSGEEFLLPVIETQVVTENTTTVTIHAIDNPVFSSANVFVNNTKKEVLFTTGSNILTFVDNVTLKPNDVVTIKFVTDEVPNDKGYYQPVLSLTNNPLNGPITDLTFSELSDHVSTMVEKIPNFAGLFPGNSNLRDISNYGKYGTRLVINDNPIAFTSFFLGKKSHNVIDALRSTANHYNQFKMNLLKFAVNVTEQLTPANALEEILKLINKDKNINSPYYRSDMIGYGVNKTVRDITVVDSNETEYPIGTDFKLTELNFQSVLIYLNDEILTVGVDYTFNYFDQTVIISKLLNEDDIISVVNYRDTLGCFVPPTPTKLGLYPKYIPEKFLDTSYANGAVYMLRGHDGSLMKAYNDYRDDIILEFEKRIFNNIKVNYSGIFDLTKSEVSAFRTNYFTDSVNKILQQDFISWAGKFGIDYSKNSTFEESNQFTWNFIGSVDRLFGKPVSGTWRSLFKQFYDTDAPHIRPWEMLGFSIEPNWWQDEYGPAPYTSTNTALWQDLRDGIVRDPADAYILNQYIRPGLLSIIPVDATGQLRNLTDYLVTNNTYYDKSQPWKFGDFSPAETAWRKSSFYPYFLNIAAALTRPCDYFSSMYDTSRIQVNLLGQVIYNKDNLFLDLRKLIIDDNMQTSGFSVLVCEHGKQKYQNYLDILTQDLKFANFNLFHKFGGFTSKEKLQINIDSIDPISRSPGVILPPEDYTLLLNVSNPVKQIGISGIIIQKYENKFVIRGYDQHRPYFNILTPVKTATSGALTVGGISEEFSEWSGITDESSKGLNSIDLTTANSVTTRYYKQGQIVRYNNVFYRVKVNHTAQSTFDSTLFQRLPSLPIKGGASAQLPSSYINDGTLISYGTEFTNIQDVFDIILGYGAWLESQGFVFDFFNNDLNEVINWKFSAKEFLYWTTQNWSNNDLITISPFSEYLKFESVDSVVDNIISNDYDYSLLKADGRLYPTDQFNFSRENGFCTIRTLDDNEGLFFALIRTVQKEHGMVFNNTTIFNDTIYDIETGYKQQRIKFSGFRTKGWNGDFISPGFVYNSISVADWQPFKTYIPGDIVRYKSLYYQAIGKIESSNNFSFDQWSKLNSKPYSKLIPNFDYKINQFEDFYSLDVDNFDYEQQQLAQHLVGYTPRTYLNNIFSNPISQYKFYQGFIKEKGTKKAIDKLSKVSFYNRQGSVEINEEWAFRIGNYGSYSSYNEIEFSLNEGIGLENPYITKFIDIESSDKDTSINYITPNSLLITPDNYSSNNTFKTYNGTFDDTNFELMTAGYVRTDDVSATAYNKNSLLDIANNSLINNKDTIWLGFLENGDWDVYRYSKQIAKISGVYVSSPGIDITFVTDMPHGLQKGDVISVARFNDQVNGVYIVKDVTRLNQFTVESTLSTIVNEELLSLGILFKFESARVDNVDNIAEKINLLNLQAGDKIWVDKDLDDKWKVYQKIDNYSSKDYNTIDFYGDQFFGFKIQASDYSPIVLISSPGKKEAGDFSYGRITVFQRVNNVLERQYEYGLNTATSVYCDSNLLTNFGYSIAHDNNKNLFVVGAPTASKIRASLTTGTVLLSTGTGTIKTFDNEGIVKVSSKNKNLNQEDTQFVLVHPNAITASTAENARFGHSVYVNQPAVNTATTLLVSAPGNNDYSGPGSVFAYRVSTVTNTISGVTTATVVAHPQKFAVLSTSSISLNAGSQWGYKIAGDRNGEHIAISAPNYRFPDSDRVGVVQIFDKNLTWKQNISLPVNSYESFGYDVALSDDGSVMLISSVEYISRSGSKGAVFLYTLSNELYELTQIFENPILDSGLKFGYSLSISNNKSTISVSLLGTTKTKIMRFFEDLQNSENETTFDSKSTRFVSTVPDSGTVYLYDKIGNNYVLATELNNVDILEGSKYGISTVATNNTIFVGAPMYSGNVVDVNKLPDNSKVYQFDKIDKNNNGFRLLREQPSTVEVENIKRITLIDSLKEEIVEYLDIIDPLKGKISGLAEQELKYKLALDPATYSLGTSLTVVDTETAWIDDHVGELWWDLSTAKFIWYEQGDDIYRKNNWGRLFPGANIDIYEWVKSDLLPSEWAAQADTNEGLIKGISGQPKYPDNTVLTIKQVYNNITSSLENVYYYWVKNKTIVPNVKNRRISSYQVTSLIADPIAEGIKFAEILSKNSIALANIQSSLIGDRISANVVIDNLNNSIPHHTEWILLQEGNKNDVPNTLLEKKLIDSLLGRDSFGNLVPDLSLSYRNRYGLGIRPQQTLFKDRIEALRNVIEFSNKVLLENRITGNYNFANLNKKEEIPDVLSREYDLIVDTNSELAALDTTNYKQAKLESVSINGYIRVVNIIDPGFGYTNPPKISIASETGSGAEIKLTIDNNGSVISTSIINPGYGYVDSPILIVRPHTVIITTDSTSGNRWTKNEFNYDFVSSDTKWIKSKTQSYNTTLYWDYVDWKSPKFNEYKNIIYSTTDISEAMSISDIKPSEYVKVKNGGNGYFIILEKVSQGQSGDFTSDYDIVYSEKGTIQINDKIWNYDIGKYSYDLLTLDETLYDQIPDQEINYILLALKENIFVNALKVNWNLLFFKAVKYAMSEQKLLDWAFKTSFITVKNTIGNLDQRPVYKLDSYQYFEEYIKEVKPYHTKIRDYIASFQSFEQANTQVTDFDLPSYYENNEYKTIDITSDISKSTFTITNTLTNVYPWKFWADNYTYEIKEVLVAEQGTGYTDIPTVTISGPNTINGTTATASAYLRNGGIYQIVVTNPGSGYVSQPSVTITGGGAAVTKTATASAILSNNTVRKNIVGIKFDRISAENEISNETIIDTFVCDGTATDFILTWLPEYKKENIVPKLDGKLIFAADYTLIFKGKRNKTCIFRFLNYVPRQDQHLKISYVKNIELFNAVERINYYYRPDEFMPPVEIPLLMSGATYGNNILQGIPFGYAVPWNTYNNLYGNFAWDELIYQYAFSKVVTTATIGATTLYLNTVTDIVPGQVLNIISSTTNFIRPDTVVVSVSSATNSIVISNPSYNILTAKATGTNIGADIIVRTTKPFNGNLLVGDIITLTGITPAGFNGQYLINKIDTNDTFIVTASSVLSTSTVVALTSATAKVSSILSVIEPASILINRIITTVTNTSSVIIPTLTRSADIAKFNVTVNSSVITTNSATSPYYLLSLDANNRSVVTVNGLTISSTIDVQLFANPKIEFWKINKLPTIVDTVASGGSWSGTNFTGAFGVNPDVIDGEAFLSVNNNFGPEELVPGHTLDSIGINVYTTNKNTSPVIITGAFPSFTDTSYTHALTVEPDPSPFGLIIYSGDRIFNRIDTDNFTDTNQYFIQGSNITVAPQLKWARIGYTAMKLGGENLLDSRMIFVENTSTALVESLAGIIDVNIAYVLVNGTRINQITTTTSYGFMLESVSSENNRACVKIYNLSTGSNNIQAWFFNSFFDTFSTFNEEYFTNVSAAQLTLSVPPANIKPESANAIVEIKTSVDNTRRRISPPWVSYYIIQNNQLTFKIDNKNNRPSGYYAENEVRVYGNGTELRLNFDYTVNTTNCTVTITDQLLQNGDAVAVMGLKDYDYIINNTTLTFTTPVVNADIKVITFTDHDELLMHTEKFNPNAINRYTLNRPILNDNYVWVYKNGVTLVHRHDFEILADLKTVQLNEWIVTTDTDKILISTFAEPSINDEVLGFRVFKDIFDRLSYKRLSNYYSTFLTKELRPSDTEIHVDNTDSLITPDPELNNPGVVIIDGERIEFLEKSGNILRQLRRSTLGTGPAKISQPGTTVIDQSMHETIPYAENTYVQKIPTSNTTTYAISTASSTSTGDGITLTSGIAAVDQIQVYYGGRQLRKAPLVVHDLKVSYNHTPTSLRTLPPEFVVNTSTQELILNLGQTITTGTDITIVQKKGTVWTGTESLLTSSVLQAEFLRYKNAVLPDVYYYGGNKYMLDSSYYTINDENGSPLEE